MYFQEYIVLASKYVLILVPLKSNFLLLKKGLKLNMKIDQIYIGEDLTSKTTWCVPSSAYCHYVFMNNNAQKIY